MAAQTHRNVVRHDFKNPAHRVARFQRRIHFRFHLQLRSRIHAPQWRCDVCAHGANFLPACGALQPDMPDLHRMARNFRPQRPQEQFRKRACSHPRRRFPCRSSFQHIPGIVKIKFLRTRQIRMTRSRCGQLFLLALQPFGIFDRQDFFPVRPIAILDAQCDGRANGLPVPYARKNLGAIFLNLLPPAAPVTQLPPVQLVVDELHINRQRSRQPRDKRQQRLPVRFPRSVKTQHK
jgi:hypothetical protein